MPCVSRPSDSYVPLLRGKGGGPGCPRREGCLQSVEQAVRPGACSNPFGGHQDHKGMFSLIPPRKVFFHGPEGSWEWFALQLCCTVRLYLVRETEKSFCLLSLYFKTGPRILSEADSVVAHGPRFAHRHGGTRSPLWRPSTTASPSSRPAWTLTRPGSPWSTTRAWPGPWQVSPHRPSAIRCRGQRFRA